ncbi:MAG: hypothetical protein ACON3Z_01715 [Bradymonadia bacterium]
MKKQRRLGVATMRRDALFLCCIFLTACNSEERSTTTERIDLGATVDRGVDALIGDSGPVVDLGESPDQAVTPDAGAAADIGTTRPDADVMDAHVVDATGDMGGSADVSVGDAALGDGQVIDVGALDGGPADALVDSSTPDARPVPDAGVDASPDGAVVVVDMAIESVCGNGIREADEGCDDGNQVTEGCAYGEAECTVCAADCTEQAGAVRVCGDNVEDPEEGCDDGNRETEGCAYGEAECTVCAADCTEQAGAVRV